MTAAVPVTHPLSEQEIARARLFIQQTHNAVIGATKGLSNPQWHFKPASDKWSIAENLDHIVAVQERVLGPILEQIANTPALTADRDYPAVDEIILTSFSLRLENVPAPATIQPRNDIAPGELLKRLTANGNRLAMAVEEVASVRNHAIEAIPIKIISKGAHSLMDGYQWILAAAAHAERHAKQMLEVKADANFPQ